MTYRYAEGDDDHEGAPISAYCDDCDCDIHPDEWEETEEGMSHGFLDERGRYTGSNMEHTCAHCRAIGNKERAEFEWTHSRERLG